MPKGREAPASSSADHARSGRVAMDGTGSDEQVAALDDRERAAYALRASEARYRQALAASQAALTKTQALYHVSSSQVAGESVGTVLQRVVDVVAESLPAHRVNLFAVDGERRQVTGNYLGGPGGGPYEDVDYEELIEGLGGWVLTHREATLSPGGVRDARESDRVDKRRRTIGHGPMMVAPILYGERALGVIVATNQPGAREFEQADLDLLSAMASQSAISIENTAMREQLQAARDELEDRVAQRTAELAESEERYRRITQTVTDYVFTVKVDPKGGLTTRHGPASVAVTGYSPDEFAANPGLWLDMVVPEDRDRVLAQVDDVLKKGSARPIDHRIVRKDGATRFVRSTPVPQYAPDGSLVGYDGVLKDITERRALEEQLVQAQKLQSIGRLAGGVAHDFNNLLTAILGNAELALTDLPEDHPASESVREIARAAERATSLTRQLLSFARKQMIEPVPLDLSSVVAGSIQMLRRLLGEDVEITAELDEGLGIVLADPGQVQQLLVNLTVNARDALPAGGRLVIETANLIVGEQYQVVHPEVLPGRYVTLTVADTGVGMSDDVLGHLFEPFFTTKPQGEGTGLGLATCHGIVAQSGGHIWVHSELGVGTAVTVLLPVAEGAERPSGEASVPLPPPTGTESVLVVEDDASVRRLAVLGLRSNGYTVLEGADAAEALELAGTTVPIDLLVSDVVMPGMRGPELLARVRALRPTVRLLLVSGHADTNEAFRDDEGRIIQLLPKPFTPDRLAHKVREILDSE
ncbi:MAG: ATP-binding protein [Candidatus Limnocylindrales bacterium]